jgi:hypothetical protein
LCPLFGYNVLSNFVADMLGGQSSASSRNLSGCFAVTTGQSERAAAKIAVAMLITLQTAVLTHFSKCRATEADAQALEEAADFCANLSCIVILKGTVATEHVGDAVRYVADMRPFVCMHACAMEHKNRSGQSDAAQLAVANRTAPPYRLLPSLPPNLLLPLSSPWASNIPLLAKSHH